MAAGITLPGKSGRTEGPMMLTKRLRIIRYGLSRAVILGALIFGFLRQPQNASLNFWLIGGFAAVAAASIVFTVAKHMNLVSSPLGIYFDLVFYLLTFVCMFSLIYWAYGTSGNFTARLTHLDAIYFTMGTLSTAGTGSIVPISQLARGLQTLQMLLDLGFLLVAVTLVVGRLATARADSKSP
jgi:voltage-gated potassium channel